MLTLDDLIRGIVNREGGFVNHPNDPGGATKYGIIQTTLAAWRKKPVTVDDVRNLTLNEAADIYKAMYVAKPGFDKIENVALLEQVLDAAVNHGVGKAIQLLQACVGEKQDGKLGPVTLGKIQAANQAALPILFIAHRLRYYGLILDPNRSKQAMKLKTFDAGWFNRMGEMAERLSHHQS